MRTFLIATDSPVTLLLALQTTPYAPVPANPIHRQLRAQVHSALHPLASSVPPSRLPPTRCAGR
jgi:hypothetical protein